MYFDITPSIFAPYRRVIEEIGPPRELSATLEFILHLFLPLNGPANLVSSIQASLVLGLTTPATEYTTLRLLCFMRTLLNDPSKKRELYRIWPDYRKPIRTKCKAISDLNNQSIYNVIFYINREALDSFCYEERNKSFQNYDYDLSEILVKVNHPLREHNSVKAVNNIIAEIALDAYTGEDISWSRYIEDNDAILESVKIINKYKPPAFHEDSREELAVHLSNIYNSKVKHINGDNSKLNKAEALAIEVFTELLIGRNENINSNQIIRTSKWKKTNKNIKGRIIGEPINKTYIICKSSYFNNISGRIEALPEKSTLIIHTFTNPFKEGDFISDSISENNSVTDTHSTAMSHNEGFLSSNGFLIKKNHNANSSLIQKSTTNVKRSRIYSIFDPNLISANSIRLFLNQLYLTNKLIHAYAYLCIFTGVSWRRLENLLICKCQKKIENEQYI